MSSYPPREPEKDRLLSPGNAALVVLDYQPAQIDAIDSVNRAEVMRNILLVARIARNYKLPVLLSTVNVASGRSKDTIPALKRLLGDVPSYDRTAINAWEDKEFSEAVKAAGRRKIVLAALWTEASLTFFALDALAEGYEVYPIVDAVGGTSHAAHAAALRRAEQAGAHPTSLAQLACELQRDWNRGDAATELFDILGDAGIFLNPYR